MNTQGGGKQGQRGRKHDRWIITFIITSKAWATKRTQRGAHKDFVSYSSQDRTMHRVVPSEPCPELNCPESEQITLSDRCCKVCRGMDQTSARTYMTTSTSNLNLDAQKDNGRVIFARQIKKNAHVQWELDTSKMKRCHHWHFSQQWIYKHFFHSSVHGEQIKEFGISGPSYCKKLPNSHVKKMAACKEGNPILKWH